jgi:threonine/homoserine/homoserine lactone efflux protein
VCASRGGIDPSSTGDPDRESLRPFRAGLFFAGANGITWMVGIGSPMVLMAEKLGADASQIGLASAFFVLGIAFQALLFALQGRIRDARGCGTRSTSVNR